MNLEKNQTKNSPIYTVTDLKFPGKISYMKGFLKILNKNFTALFDKSFFSRNGKEGLSQPPPPLKLAKFHIRYRNFVGNLKNYC